MATFREKCQAVHERLNTLNCNPYVGAIDRLYPVLDRLYLRPEGEPDTADLADQVAEINGICDSQQIAKLEGKPAKRVAVMVETLRLRIAELAAENTAMSARIACMEAELGQLDAKPADTDKVPPTVRLAIEVAIHTMLRQNLNDGEHLAIQVLKEHLQ